jgi:hypothetical protein
MQDKYNHTEVERAVQAAWTQADAYRVTEDASKKKFYAYTKSLPYWLERRETIPENFNLTSSKGGRSDDLIELNKLKYAEVVFTEDQAIELNLELDHDDSHAYDGKESFGLLIHGSQKKGSKASVALSNLKKKGIKGYSKKQKV